MTKAVSIGKDGFFRFSGRRALVMGANYWPSSCGVEMWRLWPEAEIRADIRLTKRHGLRVLRFFLRWQDFEPQAGVYDERVFERLRRLLGFFRQQGLKAQPSLFVGWMSGGTFWPAWKGKRNLYTDPLMSRRAEAFARKVALLCGSYRDVLIGFDLGNELGCLQDSLDADPGAIEAWCSRICGVIKSVIPETLLVSGTDHNLVGGDSGWRLGAQPGTDYYSVHHYPVPNWHPMSFEGMQDPMAVSLAEAYLKIARAFGPVMLHEFGTILCGDPVLQREYLKRLLPACQHAGANGFLWWCLKDIGARVHPYEKNAMEASLGLFDVKGRLKPGSKAFLDFARKARPVAAKASAFRIYLPKNYYERQNPQNPGNRPAELFSRIAVAGHHLGRAGVGYSIQAGGLGLDSSCTRLLICGALLAVDELAAIEAWVRRGGRLIWHGPDAMQFGPDLSRLLGARAADFRADLSCDFELFGIQWSMGCFSKRLKLRFSLSSQSTLLASDQHGLPAAWTCRHGKGHVFVVASIVEEAAKQAQEGAIGRRPDFGIWYKNVAKKQM